MRTSDVLQPALLPSSSTANTCISSLNHFQKHLHPASPPATPASTSPAQQPNTHRSLQQPPTQQQNQQQLSANRIFNKNLLPYELAPDRPASAPPQLDPVDSDNGLSVCCYARARIPSDQGEFYLHLYKNNKDHKEHLAIVYGETLRSASLDAPREGETQLDRIVRGAYVGQLGQVPGPERYSKEVYPNDVNCETGAQSAANGVHTNSATTNGHSSALNNATTSNHSQAHESNGSAKTQTHTPSNGNASRNPSSSSSSSFSSTSSTPLHSSETFATPTILHHQPFNDANFVPPLVRIHSECFTGETLGSLRCDCGEQLIEAMRMMRKEKRGVVVYLRQEGRGIGLLDKLRAYNLQDLGHDTVTANLLLSHPADARTYGAASQILADLGARNVRLLTNNPDKLEQLEKLGVKVSERVPMIPKAWRSDGDAPLTPDFRRERTEVDGYLKAKVERMRHLIDVPLDLATTVVKADVTDSASAKQLATSMAAAGDDRLEARLL